MTDQMPQTPTIPPTLPDMVGPGLGHSPDAHHFRTAAILVTVLCAVDLPPVVLAMASRLPGPGGGAAWAMLMALVAEVGSCIVLWRARPSAWWLTPFSQAALAPLCAYLLLLFFAQGCIGPVLGIVFFGPPVILHLALGIPATVYAWRASAGREDFR